MEQHKHANWGSPVDTNRRDDSSDLGKHSNHQNMGGHSMAPRPNDDPMKWPLWKKVYTSATAWLYTFTLLNSLTCYAAAVAPVTMMFDVDMKHAILGFSLFLFGIMFAPFYTPHVSERIGRRYIYPVCTIGMSAFLLGSAYSETFVQLAICRFFAGFLGGPIVVNIEGTFADIWDAKSTVSYYSFLAAAQYFGASLGMFGKLWKDQRVPITDTFCIGPVICGTVIPRTDWRYSQFIPVMFAAVSLIFGAFAPETYARQLLRVEARRAGVSANIMPAPSGVTFGQIIKITVVTPVMMFISEPIVTMSALMLGINFGLLFSLFMAVPPVLEMTYMFEPHRQGLGFLSGLAGSAMALITSPILEQVFKPLHLKSRGIMQSGVQAVEYRLVPAIVGSLLMVAGVFWTAYTASPNFDPIVPIAGTAVYVWGSMMVAVSPFEVVAPSLQKADHQQISIVSYFFDAYPKDASILSALTTMAVFRLFSAGIVAIFFLESIMKIGGPHSFVIFGSLMIIMCFWPILLYLFGPQLRSRSRYSKTEQSKMSPAMMEG